MSPRDPPADRTGPRFARLAAGLAMSLACLLTPMRALAADEMLQLEVVINGAPTRMIGEFIRRDGVLLARPEELAEIGLRVPATAPRTSDGLIDLSALPGLMLRVEDATQMLFLTVDLSLVTPTFLGPVAEPMPETPLASGTGATVNYSLSSTFDDDGGSVGGLFDLRVFSPAGVASTTFLANAFSGPGQDDTDTVRLDSTYVISDFASQRRYRLGDFVTGGLAWTRPVRLGGVQVSRDFSMRPDLITYPLPIVAGAAATPSTVDVLVNGLRVLSRPVEPGPFQAPQLPLITGAGTVALTVTDALGRQVTTSLPFYASPTLLAKGLSTWSVEGGAVRRNWSVVSNDYGEAAASATWRRGLSSHLTLEAHAEGASPFAMAGLGLVANIRDLAIVNVAGAASGGSGRSGGLLSVGLERVTPTVSFGVSAVFTTRDFHDLAAANGDPAPDRLITANLGLNFDRWGNFGVSYTRIDRKAAEARVGGVPPATATPGPRNDIDRRLLLPASHAEIVTANYGVQVRGVYLYAAAFKDYARGGGDGVTVGLTLPLGRRTSASASGNKNRGDEAYAQAQVQKSTVSPGDWGYQLYAAGGETPHAYALGQYKGSWGLVTGGVDWLDDRTTGRLDAEGAVSLLDGAVFASNLVTDSFAVVNTGSVAGVRVLRENQDAGRTDRHGRRLVPDLRSFDVNRLAIDPTDLPLDAALNDAERAVRLPDRSGVVVRFPVRIVRAALVVLVDEAGQPVPAGSTARLEGGAEVPVGYDGQAYLEGLAAQNRLIVNLRGDGTCMAEFAYTAAAGDIPKIGPVTCRGGAP